MITSFLCHKASKQTSKLKTKQLQTIDYNMILVSQGLQTVIEIENHANCRPFMTRSFLCQKVSKQTSELKTRQLQTIYHNIILVSESLQTDIEIEKEAITDHL